MLLMNKLNFKTIISTILIWIVGLFLGCKRDAAIVPVKVACNTPSTISFNSNVVHIFQKNCSSAGCHTASSHAGNLNLETNIYVNLMKSGTGYIDTINPNYSLLYSQIMSTSKPMPPIGKLNECDIAIIYSWIEQKAKNN